MLKRIENNFSLVIISSVFAGLIFPDYAKRLDPYTMYILMTIMYFTLLKIDPAETLLQASRPLFVSYLSLLILVVRPMLLFFVTRIVFPDIASAVLIIACLPAAMSSTTLTDLLGGNPHISLIVTTVTSLMVPVTMPLIVKLLIGMETEAGIWDMLPLLAKIIFIPFVLSMISRKAFRSGIERAKTNFPVLNIILFFFLILGPVGNNAQYVFDNIGGMYLVVAYLVIVAGFTHIVGWYASFFRGRRDRIASTTVMAYNNITLGIVFVSQFFTPYILLIVIIYTIVWNMMPLPYQYVLRYGSRNVE